MDKKNFLFVSLTGLISDIAWQVSKEGHEVRYFIGDKKERDIADGFVAKSKDWEKDKEWADIIVFDDTLGQGEKAQALRKEGKPVIGGTAYSDKLEDDRSFGQEELKKAGVNIIPYGEFESFDVAIDHVENPRVEIYDHYYNVVHTALEGLGLKPTLLSTTLIDHLFDVVDRYRDRVDLAALAPTVKWAETSSELPRTGRELAKT